MQFIVLLCVEGDFDVEAAHDVLSLLPSCSVKEDFPQKCSDVAGAVSGLESINSGVGSYWTVCVVGGSFYVGVDAGVWWLGGWWDVCDVFFPASAEPLFGV